MQRINIFPLYSLGKVLGDIDKLPDQDSTYGILWYRLYQCRYQVELLLNNQILVVRTCRQAGNNLIDSVSSVVPTDINEIFSKDQSLIIGSWELKQIKENAKKFETVLAEELNISDTYAVSQKGAYSTSELVSNADVMFSVDVQRKLSDYARHDIKEAGRCLAFETPTAAGFHIVRAIESLILEYYRKIIGDDPPTKMRNWGVYIKKLRDSGKADEKILSFVEYIKNNYRNPVSHPDAILTTDEVVVLFGISVALITQIANVL